MITIEELQKIVDYVKQFAVVPDYTEEQLQAFCKANRILLGIDPGNPCNHVALIAVEAPSVSDRAQFGAQREKAMSTPHLNVGVIGGGVNKFPNPARLLMFDEWPRIPEHRLSVSELIGNVPTCVDLMEQPNRQQLAIEENKRAQKARRLQQQGKRYKRFF